jgi:hypothetical protein
MQRLGCCGAGSAFHSERSVDLGEELVEEVAGPAEGTCGLISLSDELVNDLLAPVPLLQVPGAQAPPLAAVAWSPLFCDHVQRCCTSQTTFSDRHGDQYGL